MNNVFNRTLKPFDIEKNSVLHPSDLLPGIVKGRNLESNMYAIYFGLAADRPDGSSHVKCYFATDTFVLSIWTGTAWKTTTLA